jgi:hypothetical protein
MILVVSMYHLQGADSRTEQRDNHLEMRRRLPDLDDLDERAASKLHPFARLRRGRMQHMRGDVIEQLSGPREREAGDHKLWPTAQSEPDRVSPGRVYSVTLDSLDGPFVPGDDVLQMINVVETSATGVVACPAHSCSFRSPTPITMREATDIIDGVCRDSSSRFSDTAICGALVAGEVAERAEGPGESVVAVGLVPVVIARLA